jgi:hypothetical protein
LPWDLDSQEVSEGFTDDGAATGQGVLRCVIIDGLEHNRLVDGKHCPDSHTLLMSRSGISRPFFQLRQLVLDFLSDALVPVFLFGSCFPEDALANLVFHDDSPVLS